jgi:hypothetical protein
VSTPRPKAAPQKNPKADLDAKNTRKFVPVWIMSFQKMINAGSLCWLMTLVTAASRPVSTQLLGSHPLNFRLPWGASWQFNSLVWRSMFVHQLRPTASPVNLSSILLEHAFSPVARLRLVVDQLLAEQ